MTEVVIAKRFCGPKDSGNGGYSAGLFVEAAGGDGAHAVTLMSPPPLDTPITVTKIDDVSHEARVGDSVIAKVVKATVEKDGAPTPPSDEAVSAGHDAFLSDSDGDHLIPGCFVCGTWREKGDGMRLFTGPVPESPLNADFWTPGEDLTDDAGLVRPAFLWAALDCPTSFSLRLWPRLMLLGKLTAEIFARPSAGERLKVIAWPEKSEGRKHFASSAIFDAQGAMLAIANSVWIEIKDEAMLEKLKADRTKH